VQVDANGLGTYVITVDRATLLPGTYSGSVDFAGSTGAPARTTVLMQVTSGTLAPDAGQHYFLRNEAVEDVAEYQVEVNARGESVDYAFPAVAPGAYSLLAGTDFNNDGFICDDGEACAAYPVFASAEVIDVAGDQTGLDMTTGYHVEIVQQATSSTGTRSVTPMKGGASTRKRLPFLLERNAPD
jgi:serine protease